MPVYVYEAKDPKKSCPKCRDGFETMQHLDDAKLEKYRLQDSDARRRISTIAPGAQDSIR